MANFAITSPKDFESNTTFNSSNNFTRANRTATYPAISANTATFANNTSMPFGVNKNADAFTIATPTQFIKTNSRPSQGQLWPRYG